MPPWVRRRPSSWTFPRRAAPRAGEERAVGRPRERAPGRDAAHTGARQLGHARAVRQGEHVDRHAHLLDDAEIAPRSARPGRRRHRRPRRDRRAGARSCRPGRRRRGGGSRPWRSARAAPRGCGRLAQRRPRARRRGRRRRSGPPQGRSPRSSSRPRPPRRGARRSPRRRQARRGSSARCRRSAARRGRGELGDVRDELVGAPACRACRATTRARRWSSRALRVERGEQPRRADVPRIRQHEEPVGVQRPEPGSALVLEHRPTLWSSGGGPTLQGSRATPDPPCGSVSCAKGWRGPDLNRRHHGFQPCALPTELPRPAAIDSSACAWPPPPSCGVPLIDSA